MIFAYSMMRLAFSAWMPSAEEMISHASWIQLIFFGGLYFLGRMLFNQLNQKSINLLLASVLLAGIGESIYGLGQLYGIWISHHAAFPVTGSFFNPGPYSGWLALIVPMAIWVLANKQKSTYIHQLIRLLSWTYLFLAAGVLMVTMSRAAWLAAVVGSLIVVWEPIRLFVRRHRRAMRWAIPVTTVLVAGLLTGMYLLKKDSAQGRLLIYKVSTEMIADHPIFGVGLDRFPVMYPRIRHITLMEAAVQRTRLILLVIWSIHLMRRWGGR